MEAIQKDKKLGYKLITGELTDLTLYRAVQKQMKDKEQKRLMQELIDAEVAHVSFWKKFFNMPDTDLSAWHKLKIKTLLLFISITGNTGLFMVLEATEVHGIQTYLDLLEKHKNPEFKKAINHIIEDELRHEDAIVTGNNGSVIKPEDVRNIFLGFNDGSVEILGAVSGFSAAFQDPTSVFVAGTTVAVAGCISMAAGAYAAVDSEREIQNMQMLKQKFLNEDQMEIRKENPVMSAIVVGVAYFIGATVPVLPFLLGAVNPIPSIIASGSLIILVSILIAFLTGLKTSRRIFVNVTGIVLSVCASYGIGLAVKSLFEINL